MRHGVVTLARVILSNSKSRAVMEVKLDALTAKVEKHNQVPERTYKLEQDMAVEEHIAPQARWDGAPFKLTRNAARVKRTNGQSSFVE